MVGGRRSWDKGKYAVCDAPAAALKCGRLPQSPHSYNTVCSVNIQASCTCFPLMCSMVSAVSSVPAPNEAISREM
jgi:hypothetical protein